VNLFDLGFLISVIGKVSPAIDGAALAPSELAELDEADSVELLTYVKLKLPEVVDDAKLSKVFFTYAKAGLAVAEAIAVSKGA
jgi:hypothetical protein